MHLQKQKGTTMKKVTIYILKPTQFFRSVTPMGNGYAYYHYIMCNQVGISHVPPSASASFFVTTVCRTFSITGTNDITRLYHLQ